MSRRRTKKPVLSGDAPQDGTRFGDLSDAAGTCTIHVRYSSTRFATEGVPALAVVKMSGRAPRYGRAPTGSTAAPSIVCASWCAV